MTDEELIAWLREADHRGDGDLAMVHCAYVADRIEALVKERDVAIKVARNEIGWRGQAEAERDAAYAKGFSDAEAEISATAIGQQNIALHDQLSRTKAERDELREALRYTLEAAKFMYYGTAFEKEFRDEIATLKGEQP